MSTDKHFAARLLSSLADRSKTDFSAQLEIWPNQLSRYLKGQLPEAPILVRMARELGVTVDWLLTGKSESTTKRTSSKHAQDGLPALLVQSWDHLSKDHRDTLERCHKILLKGDRATRSALVHDLMIRDEWLESQGGEKGSRSTE